MSFSKIRRIVSRQDLELRIHPFVSFCLNYSNNLFFCLDKKELCCLKQVLISTARLLTCTNRRARETPILKALHWLTMHFFVKFKIVQLTSRALYGQAPSYIRELLCRYSSHRKLRLVEQTLLMASHTRFKCVCVWGGHYAPSKHTVPFHDTLK